jgi:uncharacterized repeat protein (TIGR03806 family)
MTTIRTGVLAPPAPIILLGLLALLLRAAPAVEIVTQHTDNARTGANTAETSLTVGNVNQATFGKLFTVNMNANVNGQALYVPGLPIAGGTHDAVFVYTSNDLPNSPCGIYAFDAGSGAPLWSRALTNAAAYTTGTPAIDTATRTMYFVSKDVDDNGANRLHAVDILTGAEKPGSPVAIAGSVPGTGDASANGTVTFPASHANCRPGVLLANGAIYLGFSFNTDTRPYHGWIFAYTYDGSAFTRTHVFCVSPNQEAGGIWQAGKGLVSDGAYVYCTTGNGSFDNSAAAGSAFGMCFLKLDANLAVVDWFSPKDQAFLSSRDADVGNTGPLFIPGTRVLFAGSTKYAQGHLVDANAMGHFNGSSDTCLQTISAGMNYGRGVNAVAWDGGANGTFGYVWGDGGGIAQYRYDAPSRTFANGGSPVHSTSDGSGGSLCLSSNGTGDGILWAIGKNSVVHAYDATDITTELWNSNQDPTRDALPSVGHFQFPMVAAGKVFVPTGDGRLVAYGLLSTQTATALAIVQQPTSAAADDTIGAVQVAVQDAGGATVSGSSAPVTMAIGANPAGGTLSGTLTVNAVDGIATFADLSIDHPGTGYTLAASATGLSGATSSAFDILAMVATPVITPAGGSFSGPTTVRLGDATSGATIHYTTDGGTPSGASPTYDPADPPVLTGSATVKAMAIKSGLTDSAVARAAFTITGSTPYGLPYRPVVSGLNVPATNTNPPATLSATHVFTDLAALTPAPGIVPYTVNTPLWSDGAAKSRWIALPGTSRVGFRADDEWSFPGGTILIKHFELGIDDADPAARRRLETRLLVLNATGTSGYGITYKWRGDDSDADLVAAGGLDETITIATTGGSRAQIWHYPSQSECLTCHTTNAGFVLGVKTRQLNGPFTYPSTGVTDNQLRTWNHLQMFTADIGEGNIAGFSRMKAIGDGSATLEDRVKSYLDANCGQCHRPGGVAAAWDARYGTPMASQGIIDGAVKTDLGITGAKVVVPHDTGRSILRVRMASTDGSGPNPVKMPPLARNQVDTAAVAVVDEWIDAGAPSSGTASANDTGGSGGKRCGLGFNVGALVALMLFGLRRWLRDR